jgi:hypothetical protein
MNTNTELLQTELAQLEARAVQLNADELFAADELAAARAAYLADAAQLPAMTQAQAKAQALSSAAEELAAQIRTAQTALDEAQNEAARLGKLQLLREICEAGASTWRELQDSQEGALGQLEAASRRIIAARMAHHRARGDFLTLLRAMSGAELQRGVLVQTAPNPGAERIIAELESGGAPLDGILFSGLGMQLIVDRNYSAPELTPFSPALFHAIRVAAQEMQNEEAAKTTRTLT